MTTQESTRLVLQYDNGQFAFRHVDQAASIADLFALAVAINKFQADAVAKVLLVTVKEF